MCRVTKSAQIFCWENLDFLQVFLEFSYSSVVYKYLMLTGLIKGSNATLHTAKKSVVNKVHNYERQSRAQMYKLNFPCLSLNTSRNV